MSHLDAIERDRFSAFVRDNPVAVQGAAAGPLAGLRFGVKDAIDIRGYRTGVGNPDWLRTHAPAATTATTIQHLLDAGANLVGKTQTDELTFSLNGENIHYGTPINPRAAGRIPGGSSSGSAVAVAGELVDFAIGTDCGGSVRAPASYCGVFGMRPSHGRISVDGVFPLAPSFDTVGWFSRSGDLLERVGRVLRTDESVEPCSRRLLVASDAFAWCGTEVSTVLQPTVNKLSATVAPAEQVVVAPQGFALWLQAFRILQGAEIWAAHGEWIRDVKPNFSPDIGARFEWTSTIGPDEVQAARAVRDRVAQQMHELLGESAVLCLPTTPGIAPLVSMSSAELGEFRMRALSMLCVAGLARLPQINLPLATLDGCPCGISIVGPHGADLQLSQLAAEISG